MITRYELLPVQQSGLLHGQSQMDGRLDERRLPDTLAEARIGTITFPLLTTGTIMVI